MGHISQGYAANANIGQGTVHTIPRISLLKKDNYYYLSESPLTLACLLLLYT